MYNGTGDEQVTVTAKMIIDSILWKESPEQQARVLTSMKQNNYIMKRFDELGKNWSKFGKSATMKEFNRQIANGNINTYRRDKMLVQYAGNSKNEAYRARVEEENLGKLNEVIGATMRANKLVKYQQQESAKRKRDIQNQINTQERITKAEFMDDAKASKAELQVRIRQQKEEAKEIERDKRERARRAARRREEQRKADERAVREELLEQKRRSKKRVRDTNRRLDNARKTSQNRGMDVFGEIMVGLFPGLANSRFYRGANFLKDRWFNTIERRTPNGTKQIEEQVAWNRVIPDIRTALFAILNVVKDIYGDRIQATKDAIGRAQSRENFINNVAMSTFGREATNREHRVFGAQWDFLTAVGADPNSYFSKATDILTNDNLRKKLGFRGENVNDIISEIINGLTLGLDLGTPDQNGNIVFGRKTKEQREYLQDFMGKSNLHNIVQMRKALDGLVYASYEGRQLASGEDTWRRRYINKRGGSLITRTSDENALDLFNAKLDNVIASNGLYANQDIQDAYFNNQIEDIKNSTDKLVENSGKSALFLEGLYLKFQGKKGKFINYVLDNPIKALSLIASGAGTGLAFGGPLGAIGGGIAGAGAAYQDYKLDANYQKLQNAQFQEATRSNEQQIDKLYARQNADNLKKNAESAQQLLNSFNKAWGNSNTYTSANDGGSDAANSW